MKKFLVNKKKIYIFIAILIVISLLFIFGSGTEKVDSVTTSLPNTINSSIKEVNFNVSETSFPTQLSIYSVSLFNPNELSQFANQLNMTTDDSVPELDVQRFKDANSNTISYQSSSNTLLINNVDNSNLTNFNKDNVLEKLGKLFKKDLSNLTFSNILLNANSNLSTYVYNLKIKTYNLLQDFDNNNILMATIDTNTGVLKGLSWKYILPMESGNVQILPIDYIKNNFNKLDKGIYPNFSSTVSRSTTSGVEQIPQSQDFEGKIEITKAELSYLWSQDQQNLIIPVYRLTTKFYFDTGLTTDGTIVVNAINNN